MGNQSEENLSKLSLAFDRANTSITRTGQAFGELAKSSQEWNIISRILSGTGAWRLQNQIRAIGNVINVYHTRQENARKATLEAVDANEKLVESLEHIENALKLTDEQIKKTPLYKLFDKANLNGIAEYKKLWGEAKVAVGDAIDGIGKSMQKSRASKYLSGEMGKGLTGFLEYTGIQGVYDRIMDNPTVSHAVTMPRHFAMTQKGRAMRFGQRVGKRARSFGRQMRYSPVATTKDAVTTLAKKLAPVAGKISQFFVIGSVVLGKFLIYLLAIVTGFALLIFLIKKLKIGTKLKAFEKRFGIFGDIFKNVKDILSGVFDIFKAAFGGDGQGLMKAFGKFVKALGGLLFNVMKLMVMGFLQVVKFLVASFIQVIGKVVGKIPFMGGLGSSIEGFGKNIRGMATGGVSGGGLTIVGERGPELVRLPSGARVHSNAESRRMGGGTINVHVNGRVGASDTEIRDIASKVAREINLQMNRQSHTVGRF
tara:strand:+ start:930 stop:2378 length:1449 start_codon:yes stop_codon:yes gene_type:complete